MHPDLCGCCRCDVAVPPLYRRCTAGKNLQAQYERWQPRAKYKMHLDPTTEDVKKLAISCRRTAKVRRHSDGSTAQQWRSTSSWHELGQLCPQPSACCAPP